MQSALRYVVFADSHVRVETRADSDIFSDITDVFGAMLRAEPVGTESLRLLLHGRDGKILLTDSAAESNEFDTLASATTALFHQTIQALMRAKSELLWLHAGAAARQARAWLFFGPSGSGKSTLVTQLAQNGWHFLADEVAPIDPHTQTVMPFPLRPLVRKPNATAMQQSRFGKFRKDTFPLDSVVIADEAVKISGFVLPTYRSGARAEMSICSAAASVVKMLNNSLNLQPYTAEQVRQLCELAAQTPCYDLIYGDAADAIRLLEATAK